MNGLALADAAQARLKAAIPSRAVYAGAVPDGTLPATYLVVWASEGSDESTRSTGTANVQTPALWVTSVSRNSKPDIAAREAAWGAGKAREVLRNWRPDAGWLLRADLSSPARREESGTVAVFVATEQFSVRTNLP